MRTRFAPTPSGYLHLGNAAHFVLVHRIALREGAQIALRIDDADRDRFRSVYLSDIFDLLTWLDLSWDVGPTSPADMAQWSQITRLSNYREALNSLIDAQVAYRCECSRIDWLDYRGDECPRRCRSVGVDAGDAAWRLALPGVDDPIIWRRDDTPAYHLASVVDDDHFGVDLVIRGSDLRESSEIQRALSRHLPNSAFTGAVLLHHDLAVDGSGSKLSKSAGHGAAPLPRTEAVRREILDLAARLEASITPDRLRSS